LPLLPVYAQAVIYPVPAEQVPRLAVVGVYELLSIAVLYPPTAEESNNAVERHD
jgi:L-2-hydroxyglutarate oxidase LhgO